MSNAELRRELHGPTGLAPGRRTQRTATGNVDDRDSAPTEQNRMVSICSQSMWVQDFPRFPESSRGGVVYSPPCDSRSCGEIHVRTVAVRASFLAPRDAPDEGPSVAFGAGWRRSEERS